MFDLYVVGAGFSAASGAPRETEILPRIFSQPKNKPLAKILTEVLYPDTADWPAKVSFQEVISRLDLIRYYQPYPNIDYNLIDQCENRLLQEMVGILHPDNTGLNQDLYRLFVHDLAGNADFLSFNYDLVLEQVLADLGETIDLHLDLTDHPVSVRREAKSSRTLLKLHGSINLKFCPQCKTIFRFMHIYAKDQYCLDCGSLLNNFLVAPTLFKAYELPAIRDIWYAALIRLISSEQICFIGYSLPDNDLLTYQMLDTAFRMNGKKQRVYLVNGPHFNPVKFINIYGKNLINTKFYFEEWVEKHKQGLNH
ncbi:hypothetical protein Tfer_1983 [Thermincola ferriacetica]|uniref:Uncharacterized protein n=1 Tax=Thermincola ferriacetica TaxID=281456 RepID=A0A0L6W1I9_9FIRM|nr:SIR2 family protein [Thermincola ferriacetica]KNZ69346.1 hypothetical protein Tfer_1983 [Thermincola ferriacetica]